MLPESSDYKNQGLCSGIGSVKVLSQLKYRLFMKTSPISWKMKFTTGTEWNNLDRAGKK